MADVPIYNRSSDDQSVSDKKDEKAPETAEREAILDDITSPNDDSLWPGTPTEGQAQMQSDRNPNIENKYNFEELRKIIMKGPAEGVPGHKKNNMQLPLSMSSTQWAEEEEAEVSIYNRSSDDQSVSDKEDERALESEYSQSLKDMCNHHDN